MDLGISSPTAKGNLSRKTEVLKYILASFRSKGKIAIVAATSNLAASLLPGGTSAHSRFGIPVNNEPVLECAVSEERANLLREAAILVWDEITTTGRRELECVHYLLVKVTGVKAPMGGEVFVGSGDFTQQTVAVKGSDLKKAEEASVLQARVWPFMTRLLLVTHFRSLLDAEYGKFIDQVATGTVPPVRIDELDESEEVDTHRIALPQKLFRQVDSEDELLSWVFPDLHRWKNVENRAVLAMTNVEVNRLNAKMIAKVKVTNPETEVTLASMRVARSADRNTIARN